MDLSSEPVLEQQIAARLRAEGYARTYTWEDAPDTCYPDHVHDAQTAHVIVRGQMTLSVGGRSHTYRVGERCDVPAGAIHAARMGPQGCRYVIGERSLSDTPNARPQ